MKRSLLLILFAALMALGQPALAAVPVYREVQMSLSYGPVTPAGAWNEVMSSGWGASFDLGMALGPALTVGIHSSVDNMKATTCEPCATDVATPGNDWRRYVGAAFGEYYLSRGAVSLFVGGNIGMHGVHIDYTEEVNGTTGGRGNYGFGYGFSTGVRFRAGQRVGWVARFDADMVPELMDGAFYSARVGISVFL